MAMGFNMIRKHVKVEPARWYWHADRLGVLVWQDMPSTRFDMIAFGAQLADDVAPPDMPWDVISPGRDPAGFRSRARRDDRRARAVSVDRRVGAVQRIVGPTRHRRDARPRRRARSRVVSSTVPAAGSTPARGASATTTSTKGPEDFPGADPTGRSCTASTAASSSPCAGHMWSDRRLGLRDDGDARGVGAGLRRADRGDRRPDRRGAGGRDLHPDHRRRSRRSTACSPTTVRCGRSRRSASPRSTGGSARRSAVACRHDRERRRVEIGTQEGRDDGARKSSETSEGRSGSTSWPRSPSSRR